MTAPAARSRLRDERKCILVVDDSLIMRQLVKEIVDSDPDLEVVDTAENGRAALQKVRQLNPDAVLLDIEMPEMSGLETLRRLGLRSPCKVIILSSLVASPEAAERVEALRLGAAAVIGKPSGGVSLDLKQKRASEIVGVLRQALDLPPPVNLALTAAVSPMADLMAGPIVDVLLAGLDRAVLLFDQAGRVVRASTAAGRVLHGCDVAPGRATIASICDIFNQALASEIWDVIGGGDAPAPSEIDFALPDASWIPVSRTILPIEAPGRGRGALLLLEDVSEKRRLEVMLNKAMSSGIARAMMTVPSPTLGGEIRDATILFADIRGFTSLATTLGAHEVVDLLNQYFSYMTDVIGAEGGIVDKFIGDGLMALFGLPTAYGDDADRAIAAARNMQRALRLLNERRTGPSLQIGIGVCTGPVVAGQIGSPDRMNYTVIGAVANLATRLEGATKIYGSQILICGETFSRLRRPVAARKIDMVSVTDMETATILHEVFVEEPDAGATGWLTSFDAGLKAYLDGEFAAALDHLMCAAAANPADITTRLLAQRCRRLGLLKPGKWSGCWKLDHK
jgi:class 3 adenylate cyclase/ActR/RegA family two-component response regulator